MALGQNISPGQGETYYRKDDYYLERDGGTEHKLEWGGKLARELGLSGKAGADTWKKALNGQFPGGIAIDGGTFLGENGRPQRRAGTDFEFSAPKSVSIQALVHGDERLIGVHRRAAAKALAFLEEKVGVRKREKKGVRNFHTTGAGLIGRVTHLTNRDGDPHLHDHGVFLNVTKNSDGSYQAMMNDRQMHYQRAAQEVYHSELVRGGREIGYEWETGKYGEPQLKGITREEIEHFSQRGSAVEAYIRDKWGLEWSKLSREERNGKRGLHDEAWKMTRKAKKVREFDDLREEWRERAGLIGAEKVLPGRERNPPSPGARLELARRALSHAVEHHTERESAVKESELLRTALQAGRGTITLGDVSRAMKEAESRGDLIRQKNERAGTKANLITNRETMERERHILKMEKDGRGTVDPVLNPFRANAVLRTIEEREGTTLNGEQREAARLILTTDHRFAGINGSAGTGKTTLLKPAVESLQAAGFRVLGLGPQHSAVHALNEAGILSARTLQSWLSDRNAGGRLDEKTVVVIDEAGLSNARDLEAAMTRIERAGARAVLVGDVKQYEAVEAGPAFRMLRQNGMETAIVTEMQRQKTAPDNVREAARLSVADPAKALENLEVREIKNPDDRVRAVAEEYLGSENPADTLVLTGTHEARKAVNAHVREARGLSGKGAEFRTFEAEDHTSAERKRLDAYEAGQTVRFSKDYRSLGVSAGETAEVRTVDRETGTVLLQTPDGREIPMTPREMSGKGHEIGRIESLELAPGDRVRITGNALKKDGITRGMKGTVLPEEAAGPVLRIRLDNGKTFPLTPGSLPVDLAHGYAQTGHSAQGLGAGTVILDLPAGSPTVNRRSFYTNLTRTKERAVAFTDDREALTGAVAREKDKTMARDVIREPDRRTTPPDRERSREEQGRENKIPDRKIGRKDTFCPERERGVSLSDRVCSEQDGSGPKQGLGVSVPDRRCPERKGPLTIRGQEETR